MMSSAADTEKLNGASNEDDKPELSPQADNGDIGGAKAAEAEPLSAPSPSHSSSGDQSEEGTGKIIDFFTDENRAPQSTPHK